MSVLCYHTVDPTWSSSLSLAPVEFERHCAWLARRRRLVDLDVAARRLAAGKSLPRHETALTFDDGFAGVAEFALPTLRRYGLPATVFVVAETLTEAGRPVDWVDNAPPRPPRTMTVSEVLAAAEEGVRIESHSFSHRILTTLTEDECVKDLRNSRELLEDLLRRPVRHLAYPRGQHAPHVRRAAARAGFTYGWALPEREEQPGPYALPRAGVYPGNGPRSLALKTSRWYVPVRTSPIFPVLRRLSGRPPVQSRGPAG